MGTPLGLAGMFVEVDPWDRLALGAGVGLTFWGPTAGGFLRLRPLVWGGEGQRLLNAFTLQASYAWARDGELDVLPCIEVCERPRYLDRSVQLGALSAGFEHSTASGWTFRYDFGAARALRSSPWRCELDGEPVACSGEKPIDTLPVVSFAVSHAL
jgi:hypothetical protein